MSLDRIDEVVKAERSQHPAIVEVLAQAFDQDPIMQYFYTSKKESRLHRLQWLSQLVVNYCEPYEQIYTTTNGLKGCAVWLPPEGFPMDMFRLLRLGFYQFPLKVQWNRIGEFFKIFNEMEHFHLEDMPNPHWYLFMLGVSPDFQGRGVGSDLIHPVLEQSDREGVPCYLETSTERGVKFYQKHGFEVLRTDQLSTHAPRYWTMKRDPQTS
jgi:ribosomal protein S18 acetylase RimI-like enzyme